MKEKNKQNAKWNNERNEKEELRREKKRKYK